MKKTILLLFILSIGFQNSINAQISNSKKALMENPFAVNYYDSLTSNWVSAGNNWDEFGDLFFEKNGKTYWLATFTAVVSPYYDYYRLFELVIDSGYVKEVTNEMLGGYYQVGAPNPPYYYEDLDNDGIKDIFVFDHGKEYDPDWTKWKGNNVFFKGTNSGFIKTEIPGITTIPGYYHGHAIADFDNDGAKDIALGINNGVQIYHNDGKGNFSTTTVNQPNSFPSTPFALKFINNNTNANLDLLAPPYRDNGSPCCRAQSKILNFSNNSWNVTNFAQQLPFLKGSVSGCAEILSFPNQKNKTPDLVFRVETFDTIPGHTSGSWLTKFYRNDTARFDTIMPVKYVYADTAHVFFIDPKVVDLNFDGFTDIFFKENTYGVSANQHPINERLWINDGKNNFNPTPFKFSSESNKVMYLYVKTDTIKKYSLFMSLEEMWNNNIKSIYTRFDSIISPVKNIINLTICQSDSSRILITNAPTSFNITKLPAKGNVRLLDSVAYFKPTAIGIDTVKYTIKNNFFESSEYQIIYNIIPKLATPTITSKNSTAFCQGLNDTLISNTSSGNQWLLNGSAINGAIGINYVATTGGNYTLMTNSGACYSAASTATTISINALPVTPTISSNRPLTFCSGDSSILTSSASNGNQWLLNGTTINGANANNLIVKATGNYTVINTNSNGCSATSAATAITVNALPVTPTITSKNSTAFCQGLSDTLVSNASSGNQWLLNGTAITGAIGVNYVVAAAGNYTVKASNGGCTSAVSASIAITVNALPTAPTITSKNTTTFCQGLSDTLLSSASNGNQWLLNGASINSASGTTYVATAAGNYTVIATNSNGCISAASLATIIIVNPLPAKPTITRDVNNNLVSSSATGNQWFSGISAISGASNQMYKPITDGSFVVQVTQNGCVSANSDAYYYLVTAVNNLSINESVSIYPNPVSDVLTVEFKLTNVTSVTAELYDINGIKLLEKSIISGSRINIFNFPNGNYSLRLMDSKTHKLLYSSHVIKLK